MKANEFIDEATDPLKPPLPNSPEFNDSRKYIAQIMRTVDPKRYNDADAYKRDLWKALQYRTAGNISQQNIENLSLSNTDFSRGEQYLTSKIAELSNIITQIWYSNRKASTIKQNKEQVQQQNANVKKQNAAPQSNVPTNDTLILNKLAKSSEYVGRGSPDSRDFVKYLYNLIQDDSKRKEFLDRYKIEFGL